jgi:type II secretory ATPase GspE/PulE/Tfp pilus assembly ATPase PilB-like protein
VCRSCIERYVPDVSVQANIREVLGDLLPQKYVQGGNIELSRGKGCDECGATGYRGRLGIFEFTLITQAINKLIIKQVTSREIEAQARLDGMILMKQDGYLKALDGFTTIEEVLRVSEM